MRIVATIEEYFKPLIACPDEIEEDVMDGFWNDPEHWFAYTNTGVYACLESTELMLWHVVRGTWVKEI